MVILLISGKANSGKDTVANYLVNNFSFIKFAFADELKFFVSKKYNIDKSLLFSQQGKKKLVTDTLTVRDVLIKEAMSKKLQDNNYWVNIIIEKISKLDNKKNIVISDFRFPNEFSELSKLYSNVITINVIRDKGSENINDISETSLQDFSFDYKLNNNSTLENLYKNTDNLLQKIEFVL